MPLTNRVLPSICFLHRDFISAKLLSPNKPYIYCWITKYSETGMCDMTEFPACSLKFPVCQIFVANLPKYHKHYTLPRSSMDRRRKLMLSSKIYIMNRIISLPFPVDPTDFISVCNSKQACY